MPVETILRAYMDESVEQDVEVKEEEIIKEVEPKKEETVNTESGKENTVEASTTTESVSTGSNANGNANAPIEIQTQTQEEDTPFNAVVEDTPMIIKKDETAAPITASDDTENVSLVIKTPTLEETQTPFTNEKIGFSDVDNAISTTGVETTIEAPKTIERLEQISYESAERRKAEAEEDDDETDTLTIGDSINLEIADINDLNRGMTLNPPVLDDIEIIS